MTWILMLLWSFFSVQAANTLAPCLSQNAGDLERGTSGTSPTLYLDLEGYDYGRAWPLDLDHLVIRDGKVVGTQYAAGDTVTLERWIHGLSESVAQAIVDKGQVLSRFTFDENLEAMPADPYFEKLLTEARFADLHR